ncbi:MAG: hypothetical protein ACOYMZ_03255 [Minisyncoccia bacterium]
MEKLNPNNQPKVEIEKTPQNNEDSLSAQEQESGKRENITLEIDGQTIEAVKYYFEYPKRIQRETGILGYERVKILKDSLFFVENNIPSEKIENILSTLSEGEYPKWTFNHKIGGYANSRQVDKYNAFFKKDKFFLSKIYSLDAFSVDDLSNPTEGRSLKVQPNFSIFDASTDKKLISQDFIPANNILKYENLLVNGDAYATTLYSKGLNCSPGGFFYGADEYTISLGFSYKDSFLKKYFEEVFCKWIKIDSSSDRLKEVTASLLIIKSFQEKESSQKEYLNGLLKSHGTIENIDELLSGASHLVDWYMQTIGQDWHPSVENYLPIFIGHDKIPQLSWGHAKYAHYFNDKSFNFFKFKHADHLPVRE